MVGTLPPNLKLLISNLNSLITVKLDSSNYIIWRSQFLNILRATDLLGFVTGTHPCPSLKIKDANGVEVFNPKFTIWTTIDTHLLSCITATLSPAIFSCVLHLQRSSEVWDILSKRFTSLSRSYIHQLKNRLNNFTKDPRSIEEYLSQINDLTDQLALASAAIDEEDLVLLTLNGLPNEFDALKTTIRARSEAISMEELFSLLRSESIHTESKQKKLQTQEPTVAYVASKNSSSKYSRGRFSARGNKGNFRGGSRGGRFSLGNTVHSNVICQICGKNNHSTLDCWHWLDQTYQPQHQISHDSIAQPQSSSFPQKRAYIASSSSVSSDSTLWYLDSAATDQMTNDLSQLQVYELYQGSEQIIVGNGQTLPIMHTGQQHQGHFTQGP